MCYNLLSPKLYLSKIMKQTIKTSLIVIIGFVLYYALSAQFRAIMGYVYSIIPYSLAVYIITYLIAGIPIIAATLLVSGRNDFFASLGMTGSIAKGAGVSFLFTLPMFIGGFILFTLEQEHDIQQLLRGTILAGFFEEVYFRAFLFGLLFRKTKLGFIPAVFLGAVIFGMAHIYQSDDRSIKAGIFLFTFIGSAFFAWLYVEWGYNIWLPVFLHTFMNLSWMLFDMSTNVAGGAYANLLRALTIGTAVVTTIVYRVRNKKRMEVNRGSLLIKS